VPTDGAASPRPLNFVDRCAIRCASTSFIAARDDLALLDLAYASATGLALAKTDSAALVRRY